jgi:hypothetical protein
LEGVVATAPDAIQRGAHMEGATASHHWAAAASAPNISVQTSLYPHGTNHRVMNSNCNQINAVEDKKINH